jgi:hypothetical protein
MKVKYRNCEIECKRDYPMFGQDTLLFFDVFDCGVYDPGLEITSGYSEGADTVREYIGYLKEIVDDYIEHTDMYR